MIVLNFFVIIFNFYLLNDVFKQYIIDLNIKINYQFNKNEESVCYENV